MWHYYFIEAPLFGIVVSAQTWAGKRQRSGKRTRPTPAIRASDRLMLAKS
jgi:hypothetical protein